MTRPRDLLGEGPFGAGQIPEGAPYELSNGHPMLCAPPGGRGSRANLVGASVLESDPDVQAADIDVGYSQGPGELRALDIAVGNVPDEPGWVTGAPLLAVEYADSAQDEADLQAKIGELLDGVRWTGPRRVDVHEPGREPRVVDASGELEAPGILRNPVSVRALYDPRAAHEATLRNLLQWSGYESLEAVEDAGRKDGLRVAIRHAIERKRGALSAAEAERLAADQSRQALAAWLDEVLG